jgi:hypothetical protein
MTLFPSPPHILYYIQQQLHEGVSVGGQTHGSAPLACVPAACEVYSARITLHVCVYHQKLCSQQAQWRRSLTSPLIWRSWEQFIWQEVFSYPNTQSELKQIATAVAKRQMRGQLLSIPYKYTDMPPT